MTILRRSATVLSALLVFSSLGMTQANSATTKELPTPVDLGTLGGSSSQATAIKLNSGIVGSASVTGDTAQHAFLQISGSSALQDLGVLSGGTNSTATAINSATQVTGYSDYDDPIDGVVTHGFFYSNGVLSDVGTLGGPTAQANGINNKGLIVGFSLLSDNSTTHAFWFNPGKNSINDLGVLKGGANSAAYAINSAGIVAGASETGAVDGFGNAIVDAVLFYVNNKKIIDLGNLGGSPSQATALNDYTSVVGFSGTSDGSTHGFYWKNGAIMDVGTLGGSYTQATAINNYGEVVGFSNIAGDVDQHAFVWTRDHGIVDLNSVIPASSGWVLNAAYGVDLHGTIVGVGTIGGESHAFSLKYPVF